MRRTVLSTSLLVTLGVFVVGAQKCTQMGPAARTFASGSLVIPMDNCYQRREGTTVPAGCSAPDNGVFRAYGLVYFLLKHNVTVYWAIDGATPKATVTDPDVVVGAHAPAAAQHMSWTDGTFSDLTDTSSGISYIGGPFVIDAADAAHVVSMLTNAGDPEHKDFAQFQTDHTIDIHRIQSAAAVDVKQVRPLVGPPPRIGILSINPSNLKTSSNVMYRYAVAAGISWPCKGDGDCAGGVSGNGVNTASNPGKGCDIAGVLAYMKSGGPSGNQDASIPQVCDGQGYCAPNFNRGPGLVYDLLCDDDFIPPATVTDGGVSRQGTFADTALAKGSYKLLWIPHWDTNGKKPTSPSAPPKLAANYRTLSLEDQLSWQLQTIAWYVNQGNNVFAECLGIQDLEGVSGETSTGGPNYGLPATRFQSSSGMYSWNQAGQNANLNPFPMPQHPNLQIGDFAFSLQSGAITSFKPDTQATPRSSYLNGTQRLITAKDVQNDVASTVQVVGTDGIPKGNVAYLGGHDYSPSPANASGGQTAGTRIVLNTLFNLGFGCADPDPNLPSSQCNTGSFGVCAKGVLKCAAGGGYQCVGAAPAPKDLCKGQDDNCNGVIDDDCNPPACNPGDSRQCYDGPAGTQDVGACKHGTQTCVGGLWGPCTGQVLPTPEVCNNVDDDCHGGVDDGTLCSTGYSCQSGACLPAACNNENARCPAGYSCDVNTHLCVGVPCGGGAACGAGKVCQNGSCVDPCANVTCGQGSSCSGGQCVAGGCTIPGCADPSQICLDGTCVADPCATASCPTGTFCRAGDCVRACAYVECAKGQSCDQDGFCEAPCDPACGAGQTCVLGACVTDACAGVTCGAGQVCTNGTCADEPCAHVRCPTGACVDGQCVNPTNSKALTVGGTVGGAPRSGGCGTGGGAGLGSLLFAAGLLARRRRGARLAVAAVAAAALVACGSKGGGGGAGLTCDGGLVACGGACTDLTTSLTNCGACGHACQNGWTCTGSSCAMDTGNPFLKAISPTAAGRDQTTLSISGVGFAAGAHVRVSGAGMQTVELVPDTVAADQIQLSNLDLSTAVVGGTAEIRVLNPNPASGGGPLVSNYARLPVTNKLLLRSISPATFKQDAQPSALALVGVAFANGMTTTLTGPTGSASKSTLQLTTTVSDAGTATTGAVDPSKIAIGTYDVVVTNPGGATSAPLKLTITEAAPAITVAPGCVLTSATDFPVQGTNLYPTSVVHVKGGSIADAVLETHCLNGTDTLGRCQGGQLSVSADLSQTPAGNYSVWIVNPGSPTAQATAQITVKVGTSCP